MIDVTRHLRLGDTIWLNPSPKLLGFHKWFSTCFEDMPKEVFEEFKRHKHTHPPKHILLKHHSHTHANATVNTSSTSHIHGASTTFTMCGNPEDWSHKHGLTQNAADAHTHSVTLVFGAANLGSPNWWVHVHPILDFGTMTNGGTSHTHTASVNSALGGCMYGDCFVVALNRHYHSTSVTYGSAGGAHQHTLPTVNTGNAGSAQTPESHTHSFSFSANQGNSHSHTLSGTINATTCWGGYNHNHNVVSPTDVTTHTHVVSGNSGYGGEAPPPTSKMVVQVM